MLLVVNTAVGACEMPAAVSKPPHRLSPKMPSHLGIPSLWSALRGIVLHTSFSRPIWGRLLVLLSVKSSKHSRSTFSFVSSLSAIDPYPTTLSLLQTIPREPLLPPLLNGHSTRASPGLIAVASSDTVIDSEMFSPHCHSRSFTAVWLFPRVVYRAHGFEQQQLCISEVRGVSAFAAALQPGLQLLALFPRWESTAGSVRLTTELNQYTIRISAFVT